MRNASYRREQWRLVFVLQVLTKRTNSKYMVPDLILQSICPIRRLYVARLWLRKEPTNGYGKGQYRPCDICRLTIVFVFEK